MTLKPFSIVLAFAMGFFAIVAPAGAESPAGPSAAGALAFSVSIRPDCATESGVRSMITTAALGRGWLLQHDDPGALVFNLKEHGINATVKFVYSDVAIQAYCDAYKIKDGGRGKSVTPKNWLNNLREDIYASIAHAEPPLVLAAEMGDTATLQSLIAKHSALDARAAYGRTALIAAAERGDEFECEALVHAGANVAVMDDDGDSAFTVALARQDYELAVLLNDAGATIASGGESADDRFYYGAYHKLLADRLTKEGKAAEARHHYEVAWSVLSSARLQFEREAVAAVEHGHKQSTRETEAKVATVALLVAAVVLSSRIDMRQNGHAFNSFGGFRHAHLDGLRFHPHPVPVFVFVPIVQVGPAASNRQNLPPRAVANMGPAEGSVSEAQHLIPLPPLVPPYVDPGTSSSPDVERFYSEGARLHDFALLCGNLLEEFPQGAAL